MESIVSAQQALNSNLIAISKDISNPESSEKLLEIVTAIAEIYDFSLVYE